MFRELVVFNRRDIVARLPALQSIVEGRSYLQPEKKQEHLRALSRAKVNLVSCDKELSEKINLCSIVTFIFSLASLGWIILGVYNPQCLTGLMVGFSVFLNFLPLPLSIGFLAWKSQILFREIKADLDALMVDLM